MQWLTALSALPSIIRFIKELVDIIKMVEGMVQGEKAGKVKKSMVLDLVSHGFALARRLGSYDGNGSSQAIIMEWLDSTIDAIVSIMNEQGVLKGT